MLVFQPTLPVWGETPVRETSPEVLPFQPTLPVWGETNNIGKDILEGSDFNPLSPCGERRMTSGARIAWRAFQPTLPVWGETPLVNLYNNSPVKFQPTLPVWGETLLAHVLALQHAFQPTLPVWGETQIS